MCNRTFGKALLALTCIALTASTSTVLAQAGLIQNAPDLGHSTLASNDGWAATAPGTTGGSAALPANIYTVTTWAQLVAALNNKSAVAKIIYVSGTLYGDVDANNNRLPCTAYYSGVYTQAAYIAQYDPATWGTKAPSGALETARAASARLQAPAIQLQVGSNTTIVGLGSDATLQDINLILGTGVSNIIIRNIKFADAFDCFPQWSPTDQNPQTPPYIAANNFLPGNFNSAYDNVSLTGAKNVWIDHCYFTDEPDTEAVLPFYYGRPYQVHDGELDIGSASDLVTVSWNVFTEHGKTSLVGSSDSATGDTGHLRTTFHHNLYTNLEERQPRDRYGLLDVYNNYYAIPNSSYVYSWGVGNKSAIYAENNAFTTNGDQIGHSPSQIVYPWSGGTAICIAGTRFNNPDSVVDVLSLTNAATKLWPPPIPVQLSPNCGWSPTLRIAPADATQDVPALVLSGAVASPSVSSLPDFGTVSEGSSNPATVTLTNSGAGILLINSITATGDFSVVNNPCSPSLAANSSCTISVSFSPTAEGVRTGTLSFSDWAQNSPQTVNLSGTGVITGAVQLITTAVLTKLGSGGFQAVITVTNNGPGTAQNVQLTGAALGAAGTTLPISLGNIPHGGGSATTTLTFPASAGASGAPAAERYTGSYTGGTFGASIRAVLP